MPKDEPDKTEGKDAPAEKAPPLKDENPELYEEMRSQGKLP